MQMPMTGTPASRRSCSSSSSPYSRTASIAFGHRPNAGQHHAVRRAHDARGRG